jgi:hypothetical protein
MNRDALQKLIDDDDLGLLEVQSGRSIAQSPEERLIERFFKVLEFYRLHGREPCKDPRNMQESQLAMVLEGIRQSPESVVTLKALDEYGLLEPAEIPESLEAILADDDLGLLQTDTVAESIFKLRHIPGKNEIPDFVAQREPCADFEQFEPLFKSCHTDLRKGKRQLLPFANEQQIQQGQFFILRGVMAYIAEVGDKENRSGRTNARMRCIFENGTESAMLLRSLASELYKDGRRITANEDALLDGITGVNATDNKTGTIYVVRSLSQQPGIAGEANLYKIGYCTGSVGERLKHAREDPTYLMADVQLVTTFDCYNLNPQKLELILHKFFAHVCLEVDVFDQIGKRHTPREWFFAPLPVIEEAIRLTLTGEILDYVYDTRSHLIRRK